jgi:hypothetical protein
VARCLRAPGARASIIAPALGPLAGNRLEHQAVALGNESAEATAELASFLEPHVGTVVLALEIWTAGEAGIERGAIEDVEHDAREQELVTLGSEQRGKRTERHVIQPQVMEEHAVRLEKRREVAGGLPAPEAAMSTPETREDVFPRHRRIEIRHAIQHGDAGGPHHDSRGDEVPLDELAGGETLLHPEPFPRPEVDEVEPLLRTHPRHLVQSPMGQAHALEVADLSRAQASALPAREAPR